MDIAKYNRAAWDKLVESGNQWTLPVDATQIERARQGDVEIVLTPTKPVPSDWLGDLRGCEVLCLASGGGQQGPLLAAAGANVTVFDNSPKQLGRDQEVAHREGLRLTTVQGDMRDLSLLQREHFDLIVHPCSNTFVPDILPVWQEASKVLSPGGTLLAGFCNPVVFIFDYEKLKVGELVVRHHVPYSDFDQLDASEIDAMKESGEAFCFGHTLEDQIGGQLAAGLHLTGFYEDSWGDDPTYRALSETIPSFVATRAIKAG